MPGNGSGTTAISKSHAEWSEQDIKNVQPRLRSENESLQDSENGIVTTKKELAKTSTITDTKEIQLSESKQKLESSSEVISASMNLINSSAKELHSSMKQLCESSRASRENQTNPNFHPATQVQTAALCAREINNLLKTQVDFVRLKQKLEEKDEG